MIDLDCGWRTDRLSLEPLSAAHATELAPLLDDRCLHEFTGGAPLSAAALTARYARLAVRRSPDGDQIWGNWVLRARVTGEAAGTAQATLPAGGPAAGPAEVAWVVVRAAQGRGYAKEAARSLVAALQAAFRHHRYVRLAPARDAIWKTLPDGSRTIARRSPYGVSKGSSRATAPAASAR